MYVRLFIKEIDILLNPEITHYIISSSDSVAWYIPHVLAAVPILVAFLPLNLANIDAQHW